MVEVEGKYDDPDMNDDELVSILVVVVDEKGAVVDGKEKMLKSPIIAELPSR